MKTSMNVDDNQRLGRVMIDVSEQELVARGKSGLQHKPVYIKGIVKPTTIDEVSRIMTDANRQGKPVYPISTGKNWGYGGCAPVNPGCILLDLSKLNEISDFDEQLGLVKIQPGVTQGQLYQYLSSSAFMMDATGAGPDTSLIGNILERGFGHTSLGNRSRYFVIAEAVLADGTVVNFSEGNGRLARFGPTAGLHELMLQSNLVIVTSMYLQLKKKPDARLRCVVELTDESKLSGFIDVLGKLKHEDIFEGLPHLANSLRTQSVFTSTGKNTKPFGWTVATGIYGSYWVAKAKARRARKLLKPFGKVTIISENNCDRLRAILHYTAQWGNFGKLDFKALSLQFLEYFEMLSLIDGFPTDLALKGCYWKSRKQWLKHHDPVQDGCGFRWVAPVLPVKGEEVLQCLSIAKKLYQQAGFELAVTLTVVTPQMCQLIMSIYFDTENELEWQRANHLAKTVKNTFIDNGWMPYRVAIDEMQDITGYTSGSILDLRSSIKKAFDPNNIIAPGKYAW